MLRFGEQKDAGSTRCICTLLLGCFLSIYIVACGGSSSSDSADSDVTSVSTGTVGPIPIAGLAFSTPSVEGITNDAGEFSFRDQEQITFRLGDIELGTTSAAASITLLELQGAAVLTSVEEIIDAFESNTSFLGGANLIRLLTTLDDDLDALNGIRISEETISVLAGSAINFGESPRAFAYSQTVVDTLDALGRQIMPLDRALAFYYQASAVALLDGNLPLSRRTRQVTEFDASVALVLGFPSSERTYNSAGDLLEEVSISQDQSGSDRVSTYFYTASGLQSGREDRIDGQTVSTVESTYNTAGELTSRLFTQFSPATTSSREITRDDRGRAIEEFSQSSTNPEFDSMIRREFDEQDRVVRIDVDAGNDGVIDSTTISRYDDVGRLIEQTLDSRSSFLGFPVTSAPPRLGLSAIDDFDPTSPFPSVFAVFSSAPTQPGGQVLTSTTRFRWSDDGFLTAREVDRNRDGVADTIAHYEYSEGRLISYTFDADGDGSAEQEIAYEYDSTGNLVRVTDSQREGGATRLDVRSIVYNAQGQRVQMSFQNDPNSGVGDLEQRFEYDALGRLTLTETICRERCIFGDGEVRQTETAVWEESYRLTDSRTFLRYLNTD